MDTINSYVFECLTDLHVGSGDVNFNIIDNEVEKDPVTGYPIIHASGIKGALRDVYESRKDPNTDSIFGAPGAGESGKPGTHKFLDARLLARPMRVSGSPAMASMPVVTVASVNGMLRTLSSLGVPAFGEPITAPDFGSNTFLVYNTDESVCASTLRIEGEPTAVLADTAPFAMLEALLGKTFAIVKDFEGFPLPVMARNCLDEKNPNLWYEEVVPYGSVFYTAIIGDELKDLPEIAQFGAHASIGRGFIRIKTLA